MNLFWIFQHLHTEPKFPKRTTLTSIPAYKFNETWDKAVFLGACTHLHLIKYWNVNRWVEALKRTFRRYPHNKFPVHLSNPTGMFTSSVQLLVLIPETQELHWALSGKLCVFNRSIWRCDALIKPSLSLCLWSVSCVISDRSLIWATFASVDS